MNISEKILLYLHGVIEDNAFERLCSLVLKNFGYRDINPIGGKQDRGRDAEIKYFHGETQHGVSTFFFYTRDRRSDAKFRADIEKIRTYNHQVSNVVVATNQKITGAMRDQWTAIGKEYGCDIRVHDQDWFVLELTTNQQLAVAVGILDAADVVDLRPPRLETGSLPAGTGHKCWELFQSGEYDAAIPEFNRLLSQNKTNGDAWAALGWCHYIHFHYRDALDAVRRALDLKPDSDMYLGFKGCILAEHGIEQSASASLTEAKHIFAELAGRPTSWLDHYNYANVLSALNLHAEAQAAFEKALDGAPDEPMIWKNLGSTHSHLGNAVEELRCYDRALELNPNLTQALISKGIRLLTNEKNYPRAAALLEQALHIDDGLGVHWPHIWYWLAVSFRNLRKVDDALYALDRGLAIVPDYAALRNLKADILSAAWRSDAQKRSAAKHFFQHLIEISPESVAAKRELAEIALAEGDSGPADALVNVAFETTHGTAIDHLTACELAPGNVGLDWLHYLHIYDRFRRFQSPVSEMNDFFSEYGFQLDDKTQEQLYVRSGVAFGIVCHFIATRPPDKRSKRAIREAAEQLRTHATTIIRDVTYDVARAIPPTNQQTLIERVSAVDASLCNITFVDVSRQLGYIAGIFGVPSETLEGSLSALVSWRKSLAVKIFVWLNEVVKLLKDEPA